MPIRLQQSIWKCYKTLAHFILVFLFIFSIVEKITGMTLPCRIDR